MHPLQLTLTASLLFTAITSAQTVYTWVDDDGTRHFSDSQPESLASTITLPQHEPLIAPSHQQEEGQTLDQHNIEQQQVPSSSPGLTIPLEVNITVPEPDSAVRSKNGRLLHTSNTADSYCRLKLHYTRNIQNTTPNKTHKTSTNHTESNNQQPKQRNEKHTHNYAYTDCMLKMMIIAFDGIVAISK